MRPGESALVLATAVGANLGANLKSVGAESPLLLETNLVARVWAFAGEWETPQRLVLIANFGVIDVSIERGDPIACARKEEPLQHATEPPDVAHIIRREDEIAQMHLIDMAGHIHC